MPKFEVTVEVRSVVTLEIEADSQKDAEQAARYYDLSQFPDEIGLSVHNVLCVEEA